MYREVFFFLLGRSEIVVSEYTTWYHRPTWFAEDSDSVVRV